MFTLLRIVARMHIGILKVRRILARMLMGMFQSVADACRGGTKELVLRLYEA